MHFVIVSISLIEIFVVLRVHIGQHATYQTVYRLESIPFMVMQVHPIHHEVHAVHPGHDLSKKVYSVWPQAQDRCVRHRREKIQVFPHIVFDLVPWIVILRTIQRRAKGKYSHRSSLFRHKAQNSCWSHFDVRQRHRNRRTSDNESELSRGSGRSHNSHRKRRHRSRHRRTESGSENEGSRRSFSGHRKSTGSMELLDWRDGQRRRNDNGMNSSIKSENDYNGKGRRHRKNRYVLMICLCIPDQCGMTVNDIHCNWNLTRSTSRSPSEGRSRIWSSELAKHLQFDLVDTAGMTEDQLREIPYTVVETQSAKTRNSNNNSVKVHKNHAKDRVDRIRG